MIFTFGDYLDALRSDDFAENVVAKFGNKANETLIYELEMRNPQDITGDYVENSNIDNMTFGQFIALENNITNEKLSDNDKLERIIPLIIRPKDEIIFDNEFTKREDRIKSDILTMHQSDVMAVFGRYQNNRDIFFKKRYNGVFYIEGYSEDDDEKEKPTGYEKFLGQWYWYSLARELAKDNIIIVQNMDRTKFENALDTKMSLVAPELAYKRQIEIIKEIEHKKMEVRNDNL